jgi:hypothetical protein
LPFPIEIALGLEYRAADQGIKPPANLGDAPLELKRTQLDAKFRDEQLLETRLHLIMTGSAGEVPQKVDRRLRLNHLERLPDFALCALPETKRRNHRNLESPRMTPAPSAR